MQALSTSNLSARRSVGGARLSARAPARAALRQVAPIRAQGTVLIGLAADSGCGKSTFMRRMTNLFGGSAKPPAGGNPDSNTLISDTTTVLCLDDYHAVRLRGRPPAAALGCGQRAAGGAVRRCGPPAGAASSGRGRQGRGESAGQR